MSTELRIGFALAFFVTILTVAAESCGRGAAAQTLPYYKYQDGGRCVFVAGGPRYGGLGVAVVQGDCNGR